MENYEIKNIIKQYGFIYYLLQNDTTKIEPLEILYGHNGDILTSMNPSIWIVDDNEAYVNIRSVNYNLWNNVVREFTETNQPLGYVGKDSSHLITENYFGKINLDTLKLYDVTKVKMLDLHKPIWSFIGLEDARVIKWDENLYLCGVRRDVKDNGEGRMELSKIEKDDEDNWIEVERIRMPAASEDAYCEKNWMPIVDTPYTWIKWCSPFELCKFDINTKKLEIIFNGENLNYCYRGDSHVVKINNYYYCFTHFVNLLIFDENTNSRQSRYIHYILKFDKDMHYIGAYGPFCYDTRFNIEFGCGLAYYNGYCYLTYSENDAISYIVKFDSKLIEDLNYE